MDGDILADGNDHEDDGDYGQPNMISRELGTFLAFLTDESQRGAESFSIKLVTSGPKTGIRT